MKKFAILALAGAIVTGIIANAAWARDPYLSLDERLVVKDGGNIVKIAKNREDPKETEVYHVSAQNVEWEWYTPDEFEHVIMIARDPNRSANIPHPPNNIHASLFFSMQLGAERDRKILEQTLEDIKKGIKVSKPIRIPVTNDGLIPVQNLSTNFVGWAHWYVYGYTFTDKAGKEVDLGIYETRGGLFNALKYYCGKEVKAGRMTKEEADSLYNGIAHNVRNCDEAALSDKLVNFRKLYNPYLFIPEN